ncbi:SLAP domain-containing protein [Lactobacillus crispatus]|uniref:SLAP domain-containing protein n=1 Tax=Lactobacillus crispatus TaxID=47770 RepID=UPI0029C2EF5D|nr:SLAP domain-containing protein [Lactobacillus crispatus]MDX5063914.1 SLAP domain-containing protein [Lactobacillus crispatus]MDX5106132.1 SLAP domain-containing protein [Lactobacillus crispatus]
MKKQNIKKLVASAVLTIGLISPMAVANQSGNSLLATNNTVQAATRQIKLTHNAYIYNYRARRVGRKVLHKNTTHTYFSTKKIHGKRYYRIGHNKYIKAGNARVLSSNTGESITPTSINTSSLGSPIFKIHMLYDDTNDIYKTSSDSSWCGNKYFKEGIYNVYASKNGKYEIGQNLWVLNNAGEKIADSNNLNAVNEKKSSKSSNSTHSKQPAKTSTKDKLYNDQDIESVKENFINYVNDWRTKQGLKPFTLVTTGWLANGANIRANDNVQLIHQTGDFGHTRPNGQPWYTAFEHPYSLKGGALSSISDEFSPKDSAYDAFYRFVYDDADSNWGHKKALGENLNDPKMAIGIAYSSPNNLVFDVVTAD